MRLPSVSLKWRQASISSSRGHLRAAGTSAARSSWFAACRDTARWMGLASSVADTAFEKITGKNVGDTVLGFAEDMLGLDKPTLSAPANLAGPTPVDLAALAPATPSVEAPTTIAAAAPQDAIAAPGQDALMLALGRSGVSQDVALRAAEAYRRSLTAQALQGTLN